MLSRKVKVYEWKPKGTPPVNMRVKTSVGLFHKWGCDYEEFETGPGNYSTAIVEMEDGTIQNVRCDMIQFI